MISAQELRSAINASDMNIPKEKVDEIIDEVDYFGNQKINYTEFLVATIDVKNFLDDGKLQAWHFFMHKCCSYDDKNMRY